MPEVFIIAGLLDYVVGASSLYFSNGKFPVSEPKRALQSSSLSKAYVCL
jgi:hypothetical protein